MKNRKPIGVVVFVLSICFLYLPDASQPATLPDLAKPGFQHIQSQHLKALLGFIASNELEGRNTGERGLDIAAKFLVSQYSLAGLTPPPGFNSMLQGFHVIETMNQANSSLTIYGSDSSATFHIYEDFVLRSQHVQNVSGQFSLVFIGFGCKDDLKLQNDYADINLKNKIVVVIDGNPDLILSASEQADYRNKLIESQKRKASWAQTAGAVGIIYLDRDLDASKMAYYKHHFAKRRQILAQAADQIPQIMLSDSASNVLLSSTGNTLAKLISTAIAEPKAARFPLKGISLALDIQTVAERKSTQNVVAFLEGSDAELKQQVVAFGAHYDHIGKNMRGDIYNGADDDGSGTVGMLEIARAFAHNSIRPKRSLLFISHAGEEKGLLGSQYYTDNPMLPLNKIIAQLNIDMIGRNDPNGIFIIGSNFLSMELHKINEEANEIIGLDLNYAYNSLDDPNRFYYRSDHYNYAKHGVPIIFYFSGTHADYHQPSDTIDKIDFLKMQRVSRLVYLTGWKLAQLDHMLPKDGLLTEE